MSKKINFPSSMSLGQFFGIVLMCISPIFLVWGLIEWDGGLIVISVTLFAFGAMFRTYDVIAPSGKYTIHRRWSEQNFIERIGHVSMYLVIIVTAIYLILRYWPF